MTRLLTPFLTLLLGLLMAPPTPAQAPPPAAELARLKTFVGHWLGEGEAEMAPGQPASKWTSQTVYQWAMGGHFLQADTAIVFEGMPQPMRFREYMGWDGEHGRYVNLAVNNMGEAAVSPVHFTKDDTLCGLMLWTREGHPEAERALTTFTADEMKMSITFLGTEGPAREAVTGTFRRVEKCAPVAIDAAHSLWGDAPEMKRMVRMCGDYDVAGSMVMMPGMPETEITGQDRIRQLFDGTIVQVSTVGQPGDYRSEAFYSWDRTDGCYRLSYVNNMGQVGEMSCWFAGDDKLIGAQAGPMMGTPSASRSVITLDQKGRPTRIVAHSLTGDMDPYKSFEATYAPSK